MLMEMLKFTSQHRALYCYLVMSFWIFLLVAGMYKYMSAEENLMLPKQSLVKQDDHRAFKKDSKMKKIISLYCNPPEQIQPEAEGLSMDDKWHLQGVLVVVRHGDRGPLNHVREHDKVDCNSDTPSEILQRYIEWMDNATATGRMPWSQSQGPFHGFPLLPQRNIPGAETWSRSSLCHLGQLTFVGVEQLLLTGLLINQAYAAKLGWDYKFASDVKKNDAKTTSVVGQGDLIVHCTRYRRTFQSALALLWAALPPLMPENIVSPAASTVGNIGAVKITESHNLAFCFSDCACPSADKYLKLLSKERHDRLESHPAVKQLVKQISKIVFQNQDNMDPHYLKDALFLYLCHNSPLPCTIKAKEIFKELEPLKRNAISEETLKTELLNKRRKLIWTRFNSLKIPAKSKNRNLLMSNFDYIETMLENKIPKESRDIKRMKEMQPPDFDSQMEKEKLSYYQQKLFESNDPDYQDVVIVKHNMDVDFNFNSDVEMPSEYDDMKKVEAEENSKDNVEKICLRKEHVTGLFTYMEWETKQYAKSINLKKVSLLRAYGLLRDIVQNMLKMISEGKPKFVLYSGHDKSIQYLGVALGLSEIQMMHIFYGARLIVEVYRSVEGMRSDKSDAVRDYYFRVVYNGQDVTKKLLFCKGKQLIKVQSQLRADGKLRVRNSVSYLCPIERIVRFIHEDYFFIFNLTNFKDACASR